MDAQEQVQIQPSPEDPTATNSISQRLVPGLLTLVFSGYVLYLILDKNQWEFLIWEALIALLPFAIVSGLLQLLRVGKWHEFIGSSELLPWALTISALSLKRVWSNNLDEFYLVLDIFLMFLAAIVFGFAGLVKRGSVGAESEKEDNIKKMTWASIGVAAFALLVGLIIAGVVQNLN